MKTLALFALLFSANLAKAEPKIGIVDLNYILENYDAKTKFKEEMNEKLTALNESSRVKAVEETDRAIKELARIVRNKEIDLEKREAAAQEFESLHLEYKSLVQEMNSFLKVERKNATLELVEDIEQLLDTVRTLVSQIGQEKELDLILEIGGKTNSQISPIIYLRHKVDLTKDVLARLNQKKSSFEEKAETKP